MKKINIFNDKKELFKAYTQLLKDQINGDGKINICLSGGSTPKALFAYWAENYQHTIPWERVNFFWGDERCVPPEHSESNYGMTKQNLFDNLNIPQENVFRMLGENDPEEEAYRYGVILEDVLPFSNGIPVFDIMMLGLGDDGHTASIFPHQIELWEADKNCVVGTHPISGQKRVSLTGKIINNSRVITFLVTGSSKSGMVKQLTNPSHEDKKHFPAALVAAHHGSLMWFLDKEAAGSIK